MINQLIPTVHLESRHPGLGVFPEGGIFEGSVIPPPRPFAPLQDRGVLQQPPSEGGGGGVQPLTPGQGILQLEPPVEQEDEGATGPLPPGTEETEPIIVPEQEEPAPAEQEEQDE